MVFQFGFVSVYVPYVLIVLEVMVGLVSGSLPLNASDLSLQVLLQHLNFVTNRVLGTLKLSVEPCVELLVRNSRFVLQFPYLQSKHLGRLFDLEVGDLGTERLYLLSKLSE